MNSWERSFRVRAGFAAAFSIAVLAGCGGGSDDESATEATTPARVIAVQADQPADEKIGKDLQVYMDRNCRSVDTAAEKESKATSSPLFEATDAICDGTETISVTDGQITVRADLEDDLDSRSVEGAFCSLIQGSDVADFTEGHELQDTEGETIVVCPARVG